MITILAIAFYVIYEKNYDRDFEKYKKRLDRQKFLK
jgi:hypothetical protein